MAEEIVKNVFKDMLKEQQIDSLIDLYPIITKFVKQSDQLRNDPEGLTNALYDTIVDVCDGADDTFGTEDDLLNIEDSLDTLRMGISSIVQTCKFAADNEAKFKPIISKFNTALRNLFKF